MKLKLKLIAIFILALIILSSCAPLPKKDADTNELILQDEESVQFHFIDVGQGDCTLIQSSKANILIDSGTGESGSVICEYLEDLGIKYLDCFIGTHPHEDHLGGAAAVLSFLDVGTVYLNGETSNSYFFEKFVDAMIETEITPQVPEIGKVYEIEPFELVFLSPAKDFENTNDNSLVAMLTYKDIKALFMGDAERAVEAQLVKSGADIQADILKVGHHGSRYATSSEFLNTVYPSLGVILCGKDNSYGHPHKEAIERLEKSETQILRTDTSGTIVIRTDGKTLYNASSELYEKKENTKIEQEYIGNKKSKVFHCEVCPNLPSEKNRVMFDLRQDAIEAGYTACGNCNP